MLFIYSKYLEEQTLKDNIYIENPEEYNIFTFKNSYVEIIENPYDCGCLIIGNTEMITEEFQNLLEIFMSENGYNKVIGTITNYIPNLLNTYKNLGYKYLFTGKSSRNYNYNTKTYLIYKTIVPKHKGYI